MKTISQTQFTFDDTQPGSSPSDPDVNQTGTVTIGSRPPMLMTVRDVEAELQLGRTRTYELIRSGQIPVIRLGRSVRIPREALRRWIEANCASTNSARV